MSEQKIQVGQVGEKDEADQNKKQEAAIVKLFKVHAAMFFRDPIDGNLDGDFLAGHRFGSAVDVPTTLRAQPQVTEKECFGSLAIVFQFPFAASAATEEEGHGASYLCKYH